MAEEVSSLLFPLLSVLLPPRELASQDPDLVGWNTLQWFREALRKNSKAKTHSPYGFGYSVIGLSKPPPPKKKVLAEAECTQKKLFVSLVISYIGFCFCCQQVKMQKQTWSKTQ